MEDTEKFPLPNTSVEILGSLGVIIEQIQPEVLRSLGAIARAGSTPETQEWLDSLTGSASRIKEALTTIFEAIDITPVFIPEILPKDKSSPETDAAVIIELTELEKYMLEYAISGRPFRMEDMRREIPAIQSLSKEDYDTLKADFAKSRVEMQLHLRQKGIEAHWEEEGHARGKRYALVIESEQPLEADPATPEGHDNTAAGLANSGKTSDKDETALQLSPGKKIEIIPELGLTPNEQAFIRRAVDFLSQSSDLRSLRDIIAATFGKSRLPKLEVARVVQILDGYARSGPLQKYGRAFGYKINPEHRGSGADLLDESDRMLLSFVNEHAHKGRINIAEIVRGHYGVQKMSPEEFAAVKDKVNNLVAQGHLLHDKGSPWYEIEPKQLEKVDKRILPSIVTPVLQEAQGPPEPDVAEAEPTGQSMPVPAEPAKDAGVEKEQEPLVLDELDVEILKHMHSGNIYKMEDLHRIIPALAAMSEKDYKAFKSDFARRIDLIEDYLSQHSIAASWQETGKARGKKYQLIIEDAQSLTRVAQQPTVPVPKFFEQQGEAQGSKPDENEDDDIIKMIDRYRYLLTSIAFLEENAGNAGIKATAVVKFFEETTGISRSAASKLVRGFESEGLLRPPGPRNYKGSRILTTKPISPDTAGVDEKGADPDASAAQLNLKEQEAARIRTLREIYAPEIIKFLNTLEKHQSEFRTAIFDTLGGAVDMKDINPICQLLKNEGLLASKMPKARGTGRSTKGITWMLTGKGRGYASELNRIDQPSSAQKKEIIRSTDQ